MDKNPVLRIGGGVRDVETLICNALLPLMTPSVLLSGIILQGGAEKGQPVWAIVCSACWKPGGDKKCSQSRAKEAETAVWHARFKYKLHSGRAQAASKLAVFSTICRSPRLHDFSLEPAAFLMYPAAGAKALRFLWFLKWHVGEQSWFY